MILLHLLTVWNKLLGAVGIVAIVVIAFKLMVGNVTPGDAIRSCLLLCCVLVLLSILPAILVDTWSCLSLWQQFGIFVIAGLVVMLARKGARSTQKKGRHLQ